MKKFLTFLIALQLSMVFVGSQGFKDAKAAGSDPLVPGAAAPAAVTPAAPGASVSPPAGSVDCGPVTPLPPGSSPPVINPEDVIVLLTEGIATGGVGGQSCGKIIECLRKGYASDKATADAKVIGDLRTKYSHCIVTGKDGLGLLSNYASLVYRWIAGIVGAICILMVIISGIQISMGGLSQEEVSEAKDRIVRSLTGLVVLFLSAFILYTINPIFFT